MQEEKKKELKDTTIGLMIGTALLLDTIQIILQLIPVIGQVFGWLITLVEYGVFILWFKLHGVKFLTMKKAPDAAISAFLETITAGLLPAFTFLVVRVTLTYKARKVVSESVIGGRVIGGIAQHVDDKKTGGEGRVRTAVDPKIVTTRMTNDYYRKAGRPIESTMVRHIGDPQTIKELRKEGGLVQSGADPKFQKSIEGGGLIVAHKYDPVSIDRLYRKTGYDLRNRNDSEKQLALMGKEKKYIKNYEKTENKIKGEYAALHKAA